MSALTVSVSPHIRSKRTTRGIMLDVIIALIPTLVVSVVFYGFRALLLTGVAVATSVLGEFCYEKILKKEVTVGDLSAVVTGILVAFNVPSGMPVWMVAVGALSAIILGKMIFGGLGCNFMNPALVGRIVMMFSFTSAITTFTYIGPVDALSSATPLAAAAELSWNDFLPLFLGQYAGTIGETSSAAILLGGLYLIVRRVIKPIIPLSYIGATVLFSWLFGGTAPVLSVFAGGLLLAAFFMATDYVTSPKTNVGKLIFGIFLGLITSAIRVFGNYTEGVTFAIILGNILVPYIDDLTLPKPLGSIVPKKEKKKKGEEGETK